MNIGQEPQSIIEQRLRKEKLSFSSIDQMSGKKVLDVGCGSGDVYDGIELDFMIDAIEPDETLRKLALDKKIYSNIFESVSVVNVVDYDYVTIFGVLEHIEDRDFFLDQFRNAKKIFITVPNGNSFHRLLGVELGIIDYPCEITPQDRSIGHKIVYNEESLMMQVNNFCEKNRFSISKFGSSSFKFSGNKEMSFFEDRFSALAKTAEKIGIIGEGKFYGAELFLEMEKK